jgi:phosphatidylglycerophosphate synthase
VADPLILVAAGYAIGGYEWGAMLGWLAGLLAVMTAYVRTLAASIGAPVDFRGPMAKQHRMAVMTVACVASAFEPSTWPQGAILLSALCLISVGAAVTVYRRTVAAYTYLESDSEPR